MEVKLRASVTGEVDDAVPTASQTGVHLVTRKFYLYEIAGMHLQGLVLHPHVFSSAAIDAVARNLRNILKSPDTSWTSRSMKEAEMLDGACSWRLLTPMLDSRAAHVKDVQTLTAL